MQGASATSLAPLPCKSRSPPYQVPGRVAVPVPEPRCKIPGAFTSTLAALTSVQMRHPLWLRDVLLGVVDSLSVPEALCQKRTPSSATETPSLPLVGPHWPLSVPEAHSLRDSRPFFPRRPLSDRFFSCVKNSLFCVRDAQLFVREGRRACEISALQTST